MSCTLNTDFSKTQGSDPIGLSQLCEGKFTLYMCYLGQHPHCHPLPTSAEGKTLTCNQGLSREGSSWTLGSSRKVQSPKHPWRKRKEQGPPGEGTLSCLSEASGDLVGMYNIRKEKPTGPNFRSACGFSHFSETFQVMNWTSPLSKCYKEKGQDKWYWFVIYQFAPVFFSYQVLQYPITNTSGASEWRAAFLPFYAIALCWTLGNSQGKTLEFCWCLI